MHFSLLPAGLSPQGHHAHSTGDFSHLTHGSVKPWRFVETVLPFATSLIFHLAIILCCVLAYKAVHVVYENVNRPQEIVPEGSPVDAMKGLPNLSQAAAMRQPTQNLLPNVPNPAWNTHPTSPELKNALQSAGGTGASATDLIARGPNSRVGTEGFFGNNVGLQNGPGGGAGAFWSSQRIGPDPARSCAAKRIIFICDASGSMMPKFDDLRVELRNAIGALRAGSSYNVIFFQETGYSAVEAHQLLFATPANKRRGMQFVDGFTPRGATNPIPALQAAFAMKPQVIVLLTDGDFPDNNGVLASIATLEKTSRVVVNTIAFVDQGDSYEKVLQQMATTTGGAFRYVSEDDLHH